MLLQSAQREGLNAGGTPVPQQWELAIAPSRTWAAPRVLARDEGEGQTGQTGARVDSKSRQRRGEEQGAVANLSEKHSGGVTGPVFTAEEGMGLTLKKKVPPSNRNAVGDPITPEPTVCGQWFSRLDGKHALALNCELILKTHR